MSKRLPKLVLEDIIEASGKILLYTREMTFEDFSLDNKTIDAVVRNFEIIGEAVNLLPPYITDSYKDVNWQRIRGFRNRVVHEYFGIDINIVWNIIQTQIQNLIDNILTILRDFPDSE